MDPVLIHAQVQMWSAKAGMSKSRTAFIETVVGKREVKLLLYFVTGRIKSLQLKNNIKSVVLKTYDEDQNYLHLTFKNNDFLFVEKLTSTDARQLKRFLDRVYERNRRTSRRSNEERADGPSTSTHSLPLKVRSEASRKCFQLGEESGAPGLCCGLAVIRKEPSSYLSINIPQGLKGNNLSIQSSFDLFFKAEELEHRCERCIHNKSIALHKFSRLPRVIIIHLKRYSFNESWVMKKDEQNIIIPKFLKLSCHCNKNTKPPPPLSENEHVKDLDLLKPLHDLGSEIFKSSFISMTTSQFMDFPTASVRSTKESETQNVKRDSKVLSGKVQQEDQGKGATANVTRSELTNETEKLKNREKARKFSKLDSGSISKGTKDNALKITERPPKYKQAQKCYKERSDKQTFREAVTQSHKPRSLEQRENLRKPAESYTQNGSLNSQGSLGSSKRSGNKDGLDKKTKPTGKVDPQKPIGNEVNGYRLINIISHIGSSLHGGHYINDTFDFRKRVWFTYSDAQVTSTQEDFVLKARLSTGYVFFYMQNEIFEELLSRETQSRNTSQ
nr:ubiquitin carboxyl-terminal hydrolase 26 isoform X2 [Peromyscus maniculatus bairdii]